MTARLGTFQEAADLVVAGAGMAGYCCAIEAAHLGASVILLEKTGAPGGSSMLSGGSFAFAGTDQQRAAGIEDSTECLLDDLRRVGRHKNDEVLLTAFGAEQIATYRWLEALGLAFGGPKIASGQSVPRTHRADPRQSFAMLAEAARLTGRIRLMRDTAATRLLRDATTATVSGLRADNNGRDFVIAARRGVALTTGGFMRSESLLETFAPAQHAALRMGGPGCTGDGLRMAWQLGADLRDMGYIRGSFGIHAEAGPEDHHFVHSIYMGAIAVNRAGQRFVDESLPYKVVGDACLQQPDAIGFQIFDHAVMALSAHDGSSFDLAAEQRSGRLIAAPSLSALAARLGIDAPGLEATTAQYNRDIADGADRVFGRSSLSSGWGKPAPIAEPPFYGYPSRSAVVGTYCGLVVDPLLRVHDVFGAPIDGLYAAGHVAGGFHGAGYMTGTALSKAAVFGRLAARAALA